MMLTPLHNLPTTRPLSSKVPQITALFWVIKILTNGMGETTSDFLVHQINPPIAVALGLAIFIAALTAQFVAPRYNVWIYWLAVLAVSIFGTMAADVLHVGLGVPYVASTAFFAATLGVIFVLWYCSEGTLSIHTITTTRREAFYWATVLATFALGTAAGDMTASSLGLGYLGSGILFACVIAIPALVSTADTKPATGWRKIRPAAGAERHGMCARQIAGAWHGALARRATSLSLDQVLGSAFRARLWPSR